MGVFINGWVSSAGTQPRFERPEVVVPATDAIVSLQDAKAHLNVIIDDQDGVIEQMIRAATARVESDTGLFLATQTVQVACDSLPTRVLSLPFGPVQSIESIAYTDADGNDEEIDEADYLLIGAKVGLVDGATWPTSLRGFLPVLITAVVGYTNVDLVPDPLKAAIRLVLGWQYEHREPSAFEQAAYDGWIAGYKRLLVA